MATIGHDLLYHWRGMAPTHLNPCEGRRLPRAMRPICLKYTTYLGYNAEKILYQQPPRKKRSTSRAGRLGR
jgi:hypothetical protein